MPFSAENDPERLLREARTGDGAALGRLLGLYQHYLAVLARLQLGQRLQDKADSADLVQETFLKAHRDFSQFRGTTETEFVGWLRQILATSLAQLLRRYFGTRRRDPRLERELALELDQSSRALDRGLVAPVSSPSRCAVRREQAVLLADALGKLPGHYREVMVLHHLEGLCLAEVARRMGRSPDSVEKLWARALIQLRKLLDSPP
jgi:RNA polymerase sigma-70 factor (ECF subfamily)